tara:strand:- start:36 stop:458 length:423 start_codon:yes stop_codon:yes gene_type:complete
MAKQVLTNVNVTFGTAATDISGYISSITLSTTAAEVVTSAMGSSAVTRIQGMIDSSVTLELQQDYPTIEKLFWDAFTAGTSVPMTVKPNGTAAAGSTNPQYAFSVLPTSWTPVAGAIGDLATASITYPISGAITKTGTSA